MEMFQIPCFIDGTPVSSTGPPIKHGRTSHVMLAPDDPTDERLWKFTLETGHLLLVDGKFPTRRPK